MSASQCEGLSAQLEIPPAPGRAGQSPPWRVRDGRKPRLGPRSALSILVAQGPRIPVSSRTLMNPARHHGIRRARCRAATSRAHPPPEPSSQSRRRGALPNHASRRGRGAPCAKELDEVEDLGLFLGRKFAGELGRCVRGSSRPDESRTRLGWCDHHPDPVGGRPSGSGATGRRGEDRTEATLSSEMPMGPSVPRGGEDSGTPRRRSSCRSDGRLRCIESGPALGALTLDRASLFKQKLGIQTADSAGAPQSTRTESGTLLLCRAHGRSWTEGPLRPPRGSCSQADEPPALTFIPIERRIFVLEGGHRFGPRRARWWSAADRMRLPNPIQPRPTGRSRRPPPRCRPLRESRYHEPQRESRGAPRSR